MKKPKAIIIEIVLDDPNIPDDPIDFNVDIGTTDGIPEFPYFEEIEEPLDTIIYIISEKMPQYRNGGLANFRDHIQEIVKYPQAAIELQLEGTVYVTFVVDRSGYVAGIHILRGIDPLLDNEVMAAIEQSERWRPGLQTGQPVNVAMSMPVVFRLQ
ncbi:hypothetical protein ES705_26880 [subsurface metagenome]